MKFLQNALLGLLLVGSGLAQAVPVQYILDGQASGSYDGVAFANQRFGILIDADIDTVTSASSPYVQGDKPDYHWFTQASISRIQTLFPPEQGVPFSGFPPYPMGLADPGSFQLMSWNIGAYRSNSGQYSPPSQSVALCGAGLSRDDCFGVSLGYYDPPAYSFGAPSFVNLASSLGPVSVDPIFNFDFLTTRNGLLHIDTLANAHFQVSAVPEPETYALMLAGLGLVGAYARRRTSVLRAKVV